MNSALKQVVDAGGVRASAAATASGFKDDLLGQVVEILHLLEVPVVLLPLPVVDLPVDVVHLAQRPLLPVPLRVEVARQLAAALEGLPAVPASVASTANISTSCPAFRAPKITEMSFAQCGPNEF